MSITESDNRYGTQGFQLFNDPNENLVKGMPDEYTHKFYRILSIIVKQDTLVEINGSRFTIIPETGYQVMPPYYKPVYSFKILTPNALVHYVGSW